MQQSRVELKPVRIGEDRALAAFNRTSVELKPHSSWAIGLDRRFGPMVRGFSNDGLAEIAGLRGRLDEARGKYDADALIAELRKLGGKLDEQTKYAKETAAGVQGVNDRAAGYAFLRYAKESSAALRRQG